MLSLAVVGELPDRRGRPTIGIERVVEAVPSRFDQRELVGTSVLTVPLQLDPTAVRSGRGITPN